MHIDSIVMFQGRETISRVSLKKDILEFTD
jgi:hypothetical protein